MEADHCDGARQEMMERAAVSMKRQWKVEVNQFRRDIRLCHQADGSSMDHSNSERFQRDDFGDDFTDDF